MKVLAVVFAVVASLVAMPAAAATSCEVVDQFGYWEVRETGLAPDTVYFLYAKDGPGGFDPVLMALANGGGVIRIPLVGTQLTPANAFQIKTEDGRLVSHC